MKMVNEMEKEKYKALQENFRKRNIQVEYFDSLESVKTHILSVIPKGKTIGIGHSQTLQKMDITNELLKRDCIVYDKELAKTTEECRKLKKKALTSDYYITGSNAISMDGRIVNVDHSGNRVAAICYGPDNVIIVVGKNKIVDTVEDAINRVKNIACPMNAQRAGYHPPCVMINRCVDCVSTERVCNCLSIIEGQSDKNRMLLLIVEEECGF